MIVNRSAHNHPELVVHEAVAQNYRAQPRRLGAQEIVPATHGCRHTRTRWRTSCNQVHRSANCISIHIWGERLVHFHGLNHIGRNQIQLHHPCLRFCRRYPLTINGNGIQTWRRPPNQTETCLSLVHLNRNPGNSLDRIPNVRIRESSDLIRRHNIRNIRVVSLLIERLRLAPQTIAQHNQLVVNQHAALHKYGHSITHSTLYYDHFGDGLIAEIAKTKGVLPIRNAGEREISVCIGGDSAIQLRYYNVCARQAEILIGIYHASGNLRERLCREQSQNDDN